MSFIKDYFEKQESSSAGSLPVRYEWPRLDLAKESQELHLGFLVIEVQTLTFPGILAELEQPGLKLMCNGMLVWQQLYLPCHSAGPIYNLIT